MLPGQYNYHALGESFQRYLPAALLLAAGVVVSVAAFVSVLRDQARLERVAFDQQAGIQTAEIQKAIERNVELLEGIGSLFSVTDNVKRNEFRDFVKHSLSDHSDIQALEWIPRVVDADRASYEEAGREDGFLDFQFTERLAGGKIGRRTQESEYYPVYYVAPLKGNEAALGFDLASNPTRLESLERARDSGETTATARITLVQETSKRFGFLLFHPVYRDGADVGITNNHSDDLEGFALGVFRVGDMVKAAIQENAFHDINLYIFDESAPQGQRFLFFHSEADDQPISDPSIEKNRSMLTTGLHHSTMLDVGGRKWSVLSKPGLGYVGVSGPREPWGVLLGGLVLTSLLATFVGLRIRSEEKLRSTTVSRDSLAAEVSHRRLVEEETVARNRDLEMLLYVTSHDLREPLRAIENFSQMVSEGYADKLDDRGQDFLGRVVRGARRMDQLLEDILMLSRAQRGEAPTEEVEGSDIVCDAVSGLRAKIEETGAKVEVVNEFPARRVDKTWATQAVFNLVANALKFTRNGEPPDIEIAPYLSNGSHNGAGIAVRDRGMGVPPQQADRIFQLFQRAVGREIEGTGAGLAIVRQIAERYGGSAWVEPREGGGSEFVITFASDQPQGGKNR